ncbi:MAG: Fe-S cluster assembly protein SufD [Solirubrobacterales bacterium]
MADRQIGGALPPLPTEKTPGWEFTDLSGLDLDAYSPASGGDAEARSRADAILNPPGDTPRVVQVDGTVLDGALPSTAGTKTAAEATGNGHPTEPLVASLGSAIERFPRLSEMLGRLAGHDDPFVARNDGAWKGGSLIYVPRGKRLEMPALVAAVQDADRSFLSFRTLIVLEEGAEAEVWEQWLTTDAQPDSVFNTVTEIWVGPGANLRYITAQGLSESGWVFATQRAEVEQDGHLDWVALGFGSGRGKVRMDTRLAGRGSSARVTGAYAGDGSQHLDFDTTQEHAAPNTTSDLAFRGLLDGSATAVWRGMIRVDPGAQQTDAFQESRNLLLSASAHADAIPGLEIEADDVRCTHAAAVAQIDAEQLHYLRAHGLSEADAKRLVIEGFLEALVERLQPGPVKSAVSVALERRLGEILGERELEPA